MKDNQVELNVNVLLIYNLWEKQPDKLNAAVL